MKHIVIIIIFLLTAGKASSQKLFEIKPNFDFSSNNILKDIDIDDPELGDWKVFESKFTVDNNTNTVILDDLLGNTITFERSYIREEPNVLYWEGTVGIDKSIYLMIENGIYSGSITLSSEYILGISYIGNNHYVLFKTPNINADCDTDMYPTSNNEAKTTVREAHFQRIPCGNVFVFRMTIGYTPQFAESFSLVNRQDSINDFLVDVVESVNRVFIQSHVNVRARLAFSYQTLKGEHGEKGKDFRAFISGKNIFHSDRYDEVFDYHAEYDSEADILLTRDGEGGRADRGKKMAVYTRAGADRQFGVAHEIGHMFDLDHNREEFSWWKREINGTDWALDNKKAYGFRCESFRTVMSYRDDRNQRRVGLLADSELAFPDGHAAGNNYARARDFLLGHLSNVLKFNDPNNLTLNNVTINSNQMASRFAFSTIETSNLTVSNPARLSLRAQDRIKLGPGTRFTNGSRTIIEITECENSVARIAASNNPITNAKANNLKADKYIQNTALEEKFKIYPNPTSEKVTVKFNIEEVSTVKMSLINFNGLIVKSFFNTNYNQGEHKRLLDVSGISTGIYLLKIDINYKSSYLKLAIEN